jgi:pyruvate/2-oxoglutarate dehydrogenase complex dihydrolipoamide dehydrogenase (E3) component
VPAKAHAAIGFKPNAGLVQGHFKHAAAGYMIREERMMTSIPGLFAAGDVRNQLPCQITAAVGGTLLRFRCAGIVQTACQIDLAPGRSGTDLFGKGPGLSVIFYSGSAIH